MNRRRANQLRGKINQYARQKAYLHQIVTVEVNPHGTSQYCSRCGAKGERFSYRGGQRILERWGKLFACPVCHYEAHADFNGSVNVHHSFYREWHWQPRKKPPPPSATKAGSLVVARTPSAADRVVGEKPGEGNPADPGQARMQISIHVKVVGLALVQRGHVPVCMLSRTAPESIAFWNSEGTLGKLDCFRAARTRYRALFCKSGYC